MRLRTLAMISVVAFLASVAFAQANVGVVSNVKVVSDKIPDVSSLEAWKASYIKPGMTDQDKAIAIWKSVVQHQHQDSTPNEYLQHENTVLDFIKVANVYGYSYCSVASAHIIELARYIGLDGRGWTVTGHCLAEVQYGGTWHMFDASLIAYYPKPDGQVASIHELVAAVKEWLDKNPDFKGNHDKLYKYGREENGWGFKRGPALLATCPFYSQRGWLPAATHGWYSTMQEFDGRVLNAYESGYSQGYRVNVQLRPGERLTRNWSNKGLYANRDRTSGRPGCLDAKIGTDQWKHLPGFGDLAPGRVGNGTLEYDVPLGGAPALFNPLTFENLSPIFKAMREGPKIMVADAAKPGVLILRMPTSYVYVTGQVALKAVVGQGGAIVVGFSDNNGLDWKPVAKIDKSGDQTLDISTLTLRRYDYRLKFEMTGAGTGLDALKITHDVQHSQRPLPAFDVGANVLTFSAEPSEGTITIEGSSYQSNKESALIYKDFHPQIEGFADDRMLLTKPSGSITFPVETPGDMKRLRFGCFYWSYTPADKWELQASFDGGRTWRTAAKGDSNGRFHGLWTTYADVPPKTRSALVRYAGTGGGSAFIANFRIDADYAEPSGGFRPVKVTYVWSENGIEKTDVHVARAPKDVWVVVCPTKPLMKSLVVELAP